MKKDNGVSSDIALVVAIANAGFFGLMFALMGYFELIGADTSFFDERTQATLDLMNSITGIVGVTLDPSQDLKVSTLSYSICLGLALVSSFFAIAIANRKPLDVYETTRAAGK